MSLAISGFASSFCSIALIYAESSGSRFATESIMVYLLHARETPHTQTIRHSLALIKAQIAHKDIML